MNNFDFANYPAIKRSLAAVLLAAMFSHAQADTEYGPLRAGESLSRIVNQNYLASPYENAVIMREILRLNPQAFINNNMGLIKQGVMLKLPSDASIRRSQQQSSATSTAVAATVIPAAPRPRVRVQTLQATLTQVRNERDQANLRARRIEAESAAKLDSLNTRINRLETEKESTSQQLASSGAELATLKQSLLELREANNQLIARSEQPAANSDELSKSLEESEQTIADKQQQIAELAASVSELKASANELQVSHESAINRLQEANTALEEKLAAQAQVDNSSVVSEQVEVKVAELKQQHQQQLKDLQASFDAKTSELTTTQLDTKKLMDEQSAMQSESVKLKDELAASLLAVKQLKQQHESEITTLNSEHQQTVNDLNASFDARLAEKAKLETDLTKEVAALQEKNESAVSELAILSNEKNQLMAELSETMASLDGLTSSDTTVTQQESVVEPVTLDPVVNDDANALISGPITKQLIVERLENPVALPLWGLLLGAFALGFTSLMMLFTRRKKQLIPATIVTEERAQLSTKETAEEQLVFRAADPAAQDPDIETLRVPPRKDPSRVAILDPTMTAATAVATAAVAGIAVGDETSDQLATAQAIDPTTSQHDDFEAKLKLLMAQTYEELGDPSAANELLLEVKEAGSPQQIEAASSMIDRLTH